MSATIDALYIYDKQNNIILEHAYSSRSPSPKLLLSHYLGHPTPRPSKLFLPDASPPVTAFSVHHPPLLLLCPKYDDAQSLAILEFLHRVIDVFEDFLGAPLLPGKIESNYDIVAQLLSEMCDGCLISNTESNSLKENVEVAGLIRKLFSQVGLPGSSPALGPKKISSTLRPNPNFNSGPAIPWRKSNVRHTSNELYVDIIEDLKVILAPSGRPISAVTAGSIAFTAKISGVPDLLLALTAPGGTSASKSSGIARTLRFPVFHPCVRLAWWKDHPGELSFIPPDGRFVLAGYEVDLLPQDFGSNKPPTQPDNLFLPASIDMRTGLGPSGADFEVKLALNTNFPGSHLTSKSGGPSSRQSSSNAPFSFGVLSSGSLSAPTLEAVVVTVPLPESVRNVSDLRPSRGEANFSHWDKSLEWRVPTKDGATVAGVAVLSGTIIGPVTLEGEDEYGHEESLQAQTDPLSGYYDEYSAAGAEPYQIGSTELPARGKVAQPAPSTSSPVQKRKIEAMKALMPGSVCVSFTVKGWVPSGIKVESLNVDARKSKGLGEGVRPYKGVKYLTICSNGVERRV